MHRHHTFERWLYEDCFMGVHQAAPQSDLCTGRPPALSGINWEL